MKIVYIGIIQNLEDDKSSQNEQNNQQDQYDQNSWGFWSNPKKVDEPKKSRELAFEVDSGLGFGAGMVNEGIMFAARLSAERTKPTERHTLTVKSSEAHCYRRTEGITGVVVSDSEYPRRVGQQIASKILDEFLSKFPEAQWKTLHPTVKYNPFPVLKEYMKKYQDPQQADGILQIQKELDETKVVLHKTIESVLERGEKLDTLIAKSNDLSSTSKMFYNQAKKQNSCCIIM